MTESGRRKSIKAIAALFLFVGSMGLINLLLAAMPGVDPEWTDEQQLGIAYRSLWLLFSALAAYNGSRTGGALLLAACLYLLWSAIDFGNVSPTEIGRPIFYIALASFALFQLIRLHADRDGDDSRPMGHMVLSVIGVCGSVAMALTTLYGLIMPSAGPSTRILAARDIPDDQYKWILDQGFLLEGEKPLLFYSEGVYSIAEGGNLLTNHYIGGWYQDGDEIIDSWYRLGEVCEIEEIEPGSLFTDAIYRVRQPGPNAWFEIWLSTEDDRHELFLRRLRSLNARKMHPSFQAACDSGEAVDWIAVSQANGFPRVIQSGAEIDPDHLTWMRQKNFLLEDEEPILFYSMARYSIEDAGTLLSDLYFGGWFETEFKLDSWWSELGYLCAVTYERDSDTPGHRIYFAALADGSGYQFTLPSDGNGDKAFVQRLIALNRDNQTEAQRKTCVGQTAEPTE